MDFTSADAAASSLAEVRFATALVVLLVSRSIVTEHDPPTHPAMDVIVEH